MSRREVTTRVGENVHRIMWRRRLRQVDVAGAVGVSQSALSRKMRGEVDFTIDEVLAAAEYFDVPLGELLGPDSLRARSDTDRYAGLGGRLPRGKQDSPLLLSLAA